MFFGYRSSSVDSRIKRFPTVIAIALPVGQSLRLKYFVQQKVYIALIQQGCYHHLVSRYRAFSMKTSVCVTDVKYRNTFRPISKSSRKLR